MNATKIYQGLVDLDSKSKETQEKIQDERNKDGIRLKWDTWRNNPVTEEFMSILRRGHYELVIKCIENPQSSLTPLNLSKLRIIEEVLNNVVINGTFNP